jgi:diphthamide synthase (EF-2-diphthine--ammonia ligase)
LIGSCFRRLYGSHQQEEYEIAGLLTTFNGEADRVAMHAVRRELVERQAVAAGLPLRDVPLPWSCSNEQYELLMAEACARAVAADIERIAFGDLFHTWSFARQLKRIDSLVTKCNPQQLEMVHRIIKVLLGP